MDFWTAITFQTHYGLSSISATILEDCLLDAQESLSNYTTTDSYADAVASGDYARRFQRVMGELALYYLFRLPQVAPGTVKAESKEYSGLKKYRQEYQGLAAKVDQWTEEKLLEQLIIFRRDDTFDPLVPWGTSRFVDTLAIEVEEDE